MNSMTPTRYTQRQWKGIASYMVPRAGLDEDVAALVIGNRTGSRKISSRAKPVIGDPIHE